jgi:hypothetical protein
MTPYVIVCLDDETLIKRVIGIWGSWEEAVAFMDNEPEGESWTEVVIESYDDWSKKNEDIPF